ncbi:hypothetical protein [Streptomyces erythrochromogenes]|uniref:hypothetical protein n=1 Tax=Streptomyces erythrochromogenes TaxID=285574 RepID=UPI00224CD586|nr:hypothetical protein [Streptomyces erythrochromogenes]MCX5587586.1 hypothetical protein [Streptomyces erythrochromogenes]
MSQQPTALPDFLVGYLAQRDEQRITETLNMLADLSERELRLVKEAAVMGWVQGMRHADQTIPKDRQILFTVADACRAFPDLYPTITGWTPTVDEDDGDEP